MARMKDLGIPRGKLPKSVVLMIPTTLDDALAPAFQKKILPALTHAVHTNTLEHILIGLDKAKEDDYHAFQATINDALKEHATVLWHDDPLIQEYLHNLKKKYSLIPGKGRNVWLSLLYQTFHFPSAHWIMHDADIKTYSLRIPYRLARGLNKALVVKAYYLRVGKDKGKRKMYGRIRRLFFQPLIKALQHEAISSTFSSSLQGLFHYLEQVKYPLSGEMGFQKSILSSLPLQPDWGLETQLLFTWYEKNYSVAQVDLGIYDHKHSPLDQNKQKGLHKMAAEIMATFKKIMKSHGVVPSHQFLSHVKDAYLEQATKLIFHTYKPYAEQQGFFYSVQEELATVLLLSNVIEDTSLRVHQPLPPLEQFPQKHKQKLYALYQQQQEKKIL